MSCKYCDEPHIANPYGVELCYEHYYGYHLKKANFIRYELGGVIHIDSIDDYWMPTIEQAGVSKDIPVILSDDELIEARRLEDVIERVLEKADLTKTVFIHLPKSVPDNIVDWIISRYPAWNVKYNGECFEFKSNE